MYQDVAPCRVCGSPVRLTARETQPPPSGPVGPPDGVVGSGDPTVDRRVCTDDTCTTQDADSGREP